MAWLAWPISIIPTVIFFLIKFSEPIVERIRNIKKAGPGGVEFENSAQKQIASAEDPAQSPLDAIQKTSEGQEPPAGQTGADELLAAMPLSPVLQGREDVVRAGLQAKGLNETSPTVDVLVRYFAATLIMLDFEQVHYLIFGSQIQLLKRLNEARGAGQTQEFIEKYFGEVKEEYPDIFRDATAAMYMNYLIITELVMDEGGRCHLTTKGLEYLRWIVNTGRQENKAC